MRFTIRDLLWLTVIVALVAGWWVHSSKWEAFHNEVWFELNEKLLAIQDARWELGGEKLGLEEKNRDLEAELEGRRRQLRSLLELSEDAPLPNHWDKLTATGQSIPN